MAAVWHDGGVDEESGAARHMFTFDRVPLIFADVGGGELWRDLLRRLRETMG